MRYLEKTKVSPSIIDKLVTHLKSIRDTNASANGELPLPGKICPSSTIASATATAPPTIPTGRLEIGADEGLLNSTQILPNATNINASAVGGKGKCETGTGAKAGSKRKQQKQQTLQQQQLLFMDASPNHSLSPSSCSSPNSTHNPNDSNNNNLSTSHGSDTSPPYTNGINQHTSGVSRFLTAAAAAADSMKLDYLNVTSKFSKSRSRSNSCRSDASSTVTKPATAYIAPVPVIKSESQFAAMEQEYSNNTADCHSAAINLCVTPHSSRGSPGCSSSAGSVSHIDNYVNAAHDNDYQMYSEYEPLDFSRPLNLCKNESYRFIPEEGVWRPW